MVSQDATCGCKEIKSGSSAKFLVRLEEDGVFENCTNKKFSISYSETEGLDSELIIASTKTKIRAVWFTGKGNEVIRLPTIQIDTVPSPPPSPVELTPPEELDEIEEALDENEIQLDLDTTEQDSENSSEDLKDFLKSYVEDILSQAMVLAEKKLQFAGLPEDEEDEPEPEPEPAETSPEPAKEPEKEIIDESEVRATAEKVVQEVIEKASETAAEKLEKSLADLNFPDLPSIQIDTCKSAPPSPEMEEEVQPPNKRWTFKVDEDSESEKNLEPEKEKQAPLVYTLHFVNLYN